MDLDFIKGIYISQKKALRILKQHGNASYSELKDFISDCGHKKLYKAKTVFLWLGY
tara:strand:- start:244 stop:411 length:168 start_codon:yes stop_codon:yes gene_type:complete